MADSPTPQFSEVTTGDTPHVSPATVPQSNYAMPAPQIVYGAVPGVSNGIPVTPSMVVPPDMTQPTPTTPEA